VLVAGVIGLGFYRNWFNLTVDKNKIERDTDAVKEKWSQPQVATGTVAAVEAGENRFTLTTADDPKMLFRLTNASKFWRNKEKGTLADLKAGDQVSVKFQEKDGKKEASSVTISQK
jgi:Cu/Ag efflux protein CusF